jgi:hypothetical protein
MRRCGVILLCSLVLLAGAHGPCHPFAALASQHAQSAAAVKVCNTVTKTVNGTKKKVKVCKTVTQLQEARQLAAALAAAKDDATWYSALLSIMTAIKLGVSTPPGKALVPGAPMGSHAFYLYDFELHGLAASLSVHSTGTLSELTASLTAGGITAGGKPLDSGRARRG